MVFLQDANYFPPVVDGFWGVGQLPPHRSVWCRQSVERAHNPWSQAQLLQMAGVRDKAWVREGVDLPASHNIPPYSVVRFPLFRVVQDNCSQTIYFCARGAIGGCSHLKQSTSLRWCFLPECGGWDQSEALRAPFGAFYFRLVSLSAGDVKLDLSCFHSRVLVYFVFPKHFIRWRKSRGERVTGMDLNVRQKERV